MVIELVFTIEHNPEGKALRVVHESLIIGDLSKKEARYIDQKYAVH
jgi:hypothetical protein